MSAVTAAVPAKKGDDATWSDCVAAVHRIEHAAKQLPVYSDRIALCNDVYAQIAAVATQTEAKAKAALSARHAAASAVDPKFAASVAAQVHSGGSGSAAFKHEYAPPASADELKTFRLELHLGAYCDDPARDVPHCGDKLSSAQFTGQWRKATLRWGPPTADGLVPELIAVWPKTPAQVAARLATPHEFPPISNPSGMWLMRDPAPAAGAANPSAPSSTFYVVDGAYRLAYLADPAHRPPYAVGWPCFVIEHEPRFEFFAHHWNAKRPSAVAAAVASPAVPPSHTATPNPTPVATPTGKVAATNADAKVAAK